MEPEAEKTTSEKVEAFIEAGQKKYALADKLGICRQTLNKKLKRNNWKASELFILESNGII